MPTAYLQIPSTYLYITKPNTGSVYTVKNRFLHLGTYVQRISTITWALCLKCNKAKNVTRRIGLEFVPRTSVADPDLDPMGPMDPDLDSQSESGSGGQNFKSVWKIFTS
jgi:hypothetical protein